MEEGDVDECIWEQTKVRLFSDISIVKNIYKHI